GPTAAAVAMGTGPRMSLSGTRDGIAEARRLGLSGFLTYQAGNLVAATRIGDWQMFRSLTAELVQYQRDPDSAQWITDVSAWPEAWTGRDLGGRPEALLVEAE